MQYRDFKVVIYDLDGTLFRGNEPVEGAAESVQRARDAGCEIRFLTNNATQTRATYLEKLERMGFHPSLSEIESSATGTGWYLRRNGFSRVGVLGEPGLIQTIREYGVDAQSCDAELAMPVDAVVVGLHRTVTYDGINHAMQLIRAGASFIATNRDATYPLEGGKVIPGAGTVVAAVATAAEQEPQVVIGKPNPFLVQIILEASGALPEEALVIGDRMDTDIAAGTAAGCRTLLVLTGVCPAPPAVQPWLASVADLS